MRSLQSLLVASSLAILAVAACGGVVDDNSSDDDANLTAKKPPADTQDCPEVSPPAPGFCSDGTTSPVVDANGCNLGLDCIRGDAGTGGLPATTPVDCASVGGACVGLAPSACASPNRVGDANAFSCGGGVGVMCCLPSCPELDAPPPDFCKDGKQLVGAKTETGCQSYTCRRTIDATMSTTSATVAPFEQIEVVLGGEGVGGYVWAVEDNGGLRAPTEKLTAATAGVGSGATKSFVWEDLRAGTYTVKLKSWRSFSGEVAATRVYTFIVKN